MATVGQALTSVESGWKRINDSDGRFIYKPSASTNTDTGAYTGSDKRVPPGGYAYFKFNSSRLRILGTRYTSSVSNNADIYIDNVLVGNINQIGSLQNITLFFDYTCGSGTHDCKIINNDTSGSLSFDAIDIDSSGYLIGTVGCILSTVDPGWRRIDTDGRTLFTGGTPTSYTSTSFGYYRQEWNNINIVATMKINSNNFRLIARGTGVTYSGNINIDIDGTVETFSESFLTNNDCLVYEKLNLGSGVHIVRIWGTDGAYITIDSIDLDDTGKLLHPILTEKYKILDMEIGDVIPAKYSATAGGGAGSLYDIGTPVDWLIPNSGLGNVTGGGLYLIKTKKGLLISDRCAQSTLTWDTLNSWGYIEGSIYNQFNGVDNGGLNVDNAKTASKPCCTVCNDELYVMWLESNVIRCKKFNGVTWSLVPNTGLPVTNYTMLSLCSHNNNLYLAYVDSGYNIFCKRFDGSSWVTFDTGVKINNGSGYEANLVSYKGNLYLLSIEPGNYNMCIFIRKFNGSSWTTVISNLYANYNYAGSGISVVVYNNLMWISWSEYYASLNTYSALVSNFDGTTYSGARVLNAYNPSSSSTYAYSPVIYGCKGNMYVVWSEKNGNNYNYTEIKSKVNYGATGTTWNDIETGTLAYTPNSGIASRTLISDNSDIYLVWSESSQIRAKRFPGPGANTWITSDNNRSLNFDTAKSADTIVSVCYRGKVYLLWIEVGKLRVKQLTEKYLLRCLDGGVAYCGADGNPVANSGLNYGAWPDTNEWDSYIWHNDLGGKITPGDPNIWNFNTVSMTKSTPSYKVSNSNYRIYRGSTPQAYYVASWVSTTNAGFRPVLEFIEKDSKQTNLFY